MGSKDKKKQKNKNSNKKTAGNGKDDGEVQIIMDDRFASVQFDPRFMEAPRKRSKVTIDSRFQHIFTDSSFATSSAPIDKRGKPTDKSNKAAASLKHYYSLVQQKDGDEKSSIRVEEGDNDLGTDNIASHPESESEIQKFDDYDEQSFDESVSASSTDSDDEFIDDEEEDTIFHALEENVPDIDKETHRLAVVNLDWSQVRAVDLYVLLSSFLPKGGQIISVTVYPSEFGLKRMEEEAIRGPIGLFDEDDEHDNEDDDEIDNKKLRAYELSRLRYYFAVVKCNSSATADYLYKNCDGVEFERSANKLDLRFIPDSMDFKHQPRDVATEAPVDYEGVDFQTRALQQSNIHLTWDDDEPQRTKTLNRKLKTGQLAELELKEFLASDESDTDEDGNVDSTVDRSMKKCKRQDMYRALIQSGDDDSDDPHEDDTYQDMEVTFNSGLEDISKRILEKKDKKSETVWDAYLRKRKERKKARKNRSKNSSEDDTSDTDQELTEQHDDFFVEEPSAMESIEKHVRNTKRGKSVQETAQEAEASRAELELLLADDKGADTNLKGYNLKPKKKGEKRKDIPDEEKIPTVNTDDPRFSALFTSSLFALDPTDPQFKRSATYTRQIAQKRKMVDQEDGGLEVHSEVPDQVSEKHKGKHAKFDGAPQRKEKYELSSIVKSIKMKSKQASLPSQGNVARKVKHLKHKTESEMRGLSPC